MTTVLCPLCKTNTVELANWSFEQTTVEVPVCDDHQPTISVCLRTSAVLDLNPGLASGEDLIDRVAMAVALDVALQVAPHQPDCVKIAQAADLGDGYTISIERPMVAGNVGSVRVASRNRPDQAVSGHFVTLV